MKVKTMLLLSLIIMIQCKSVEEIKEQQEEPRTEEATGEEVDPNYWYAGVSTVTVRIRKVKTIAVSYNSDKKTDDSLYFWAVTDGSVAAIKGQGNKCIISGKREGTTMVVASHPDIPQPYAFKVICTEENPQTKTFQRTQTERTEGRLVGGWSNLEMAENWGD